MEKKTIIKVKDWVKLKKIGLGRRVIVKGKHAATPAPGAGVNGKTGTIIALFFHVTGRDNIRYGVEMDEPFFNGSNLVIPIYEGEKVYYLEECKGGHGLWLSNERIVFI